jgi:hypothetical protein
VVLLLLVLLLHLLLHFLLDLLIPPVLHEHCRPHLPSGPHLVAGGVVLPVVMNGAHCGDLSNGAQPPPAAFLVRGRTRVVVLPPVMDVLRHRDLADGSQRHAWLLLGEGGFKWSRRALCREKEGCEEIERFGLQVRRSDERAAT